MGHPPPQALLRLPAVNYGGRPAVGVPADAPVVERFLRHDGRLYWHTALGDPEASSCLRVRA